MDLIKIKSYLSGKGKLHLLLLFYGFGVIGISSPLKELFLIATPFNLILSFVIIMSSIVQRDKVFFIYLLLSALGGYLFEVLGVKTGVVFGEYWYGETLGVKIFDVPVTIALNWFLLSFAACSVVNNVKYSNFMKALLASVLMVGLDVFIEPIAMKLDFWQWEDGVVPLHNYIGWFLIAFGVNFYFFQKKISGSLLALKFYFVQLGFFVCLNILL